MRCVSRHLVYVILYRRRWCVWSIIKEESSSPLKILEKHGPIECHGSFLERWDSASACPDYRDIVLCSTSNEADRPVTLLLYRPTSACFIPRPFNRSLHDNELTSLRDGVFDELGSLTVL